MDLAYSLWFLPLGKKKNIAKTSLIWSLLSCANDIIQTRTTEDIKRAGPASSSWPDAPPSLIANRAQLSVVTLPPPSFTGSECRSRAPLTWEGAGLKRRKVSRLDAGSSTCVSSKQANGPNTRQCASVQSEWLQRSLRGLFPSEWSYGSSFIRNRSEDAVLCFKSHSWLCHIQELMCKRCKH